MIDDFDTLAAQGLAARGDLFGDEQEAPQQAEPFTAPALNTSLPFPKPGIYFGMAEETYHGIHAVSASGLKKYAVSSMDYWAYSPHLNPDYEDTQRDYLDFGKAIHCFVLEGADCYAARYAVDLDLADYKDKGVLVSTDEIKAAIGKHTRFAAVKPAGSGKQGLIDQLAELGARHDRPVDLDGTVPQLRERIGEFEEEQAVRPVTRVADTLEDGTEFNRPASKADWITQLLELDPDALVWDAMLAAHHAANDGKAMISARDHRRINIAAKMILGHDEIGAAFTGGYPEVSVFWHCSQTGVPMKARFDYLKMRAIVDLKSFGNNQGMPIDRAIERTIATYRYNLQHALYIEAARAAKAMIVAEMDGGAPPVFVPEEMRGEFDAIVGFCLKWATQPDDPGFIFVFQQTGLAPVTRGKIMPTGTVYSVTRSRLLDLKERWKASASAFGLDPWLDIAPITEIEDEAIPLFATEI